MDKITSSFSSSSLCPISFLLLCCLFMSENVFTRQHWARRFMEVYVDNPGNEIIMTNKVIDYYFGPLLETAFLEVCDYEYSTDGVNFTHLMRCDVRDQKEDFWSGLTMRFKKFGAKLWFLETIQPVSGSFWSDADTAPMVRVRNTKMILDAKPRALLNKLIYPEGYLKIKFIPEPEDGEVNYIRIHGFWRVNGAYQGDSFDQVYYVYRMGPPISEK